MYIHSYEKIIPKRFENNKKVIFLTSKNIFLNVWKQVKDVVKNNEFQLCGICKVINYNNYIFTYLEYLYSHEQKISGGSVNWTMNDILKYVKNKKFNCHFSIHRHLGHFGFSAIDSGEGGIQNRFQLGTKNLYQLDLIGYFDDDIFDIVDIHFRRYEGNYITIFNKVYYFMFSDESEYEEGDIFVSSDLRTFNKVDTIYDFLINFETNYKYKRKFDSNILKALISLFDKYTKTDVKIDKSHFVEQLPFNYKYRWWWI